MDCPVCFNEFEQKVDIACHHHVCVDCIRHSTKRNHYICPICRKHYFSAPSFLVKPDGYAFQGMLLKENDCSYDNCDEDYYSDEEESDDDDDPFDPVLLREPPRDPPREGAVRRPLKRSDGRLTADYEQFIDGYWVERYHEGRTRSCFQVLEPSSRRWLSVHPDRVKALLESNYNIDIILLKERYTNGEWKEEEQKIIRKANIKYL